LIVLPVVPLDKVRKRLGVTRASLGSLSESVAIFDPAPLKEIAVELGHTIRSRPNGRFDAVGQRITAVDGTVVETVKRVAELSWTPKRTDHPVRLICVEVKPHESYRGMRGPDCDGVLRLVTNRLDVPG
jgi:hypothetical protein